MTFKEWHRRVWLQWSKKQKVLAYLTWPSYLLALWMHYRREQED